MSDFSIFRSRDWSEYWGAKEQQDLATLESDYRRGSDGIKTTDKSEAAHWQSSRLKYHASRQKLDLHMGMFGKRYPQSSMEYKDALFMYRKNKPALEQLLENIQKMETRFQQRDDTLELAKSDDKSDIRAKIMDLLVTLPGESDEEDDKELEKNVKRMYGHKTDDGTEMVWDPVKGDWSAVSEMKAIHLTPYALDPQLVAYLYGPTFKRDINTADNGLYLPVAVEEAYRDYHISLVPAVDKDAPGNSLPEWKILLLDRPAVGDNIAYGTTTFNDLHNRKLSFRPENDFRPRARFPYLHYSFALVRFIRKAKGVGARDPNAPEVKAVPELLNAWALEKAHLADNCQTMVDEELMRAKEKMWEE